MGDPKSAGVVNRRTPTGSDRAIGSLETDALLIPGEYERRSTAREETHERGLDQDRSEADPDTLE
jgi:hypothetical protein